MEVNSLSAPPVSFTSLQLNEKEIMFKTLALIQFFIYTLLSRFHFIDTPWLGKNQSCDNYIGKIHGVND
jgi:hypothetical protein